MCFLIDDPAMINPQTEYILRMSQFAVKTIMATTVTGGQTSVGVSEFTETSQ